jgi:hypothetical protein
VGYHIRALLGRCAVFATYANHGDEAASVKKVHGQHIEIDK